jgi:DNA primase
MDIRGRRNTGHSYAPEQIKRILAGSGVDIESEVDTDFIIFCPFHGNHRTPAGEIDKVRGTFFCFSCHHVADLAEFVMHQTGRTYFEAIRFIKSKEVATSLESEINQKLIEKPMYVQYDELQVKRLHSTALDSPRAQTYYSGRKITDSSIKKFGLGYSEKQDMITIPVHAPDGMLVGFVGRSVEGKTFKNTPGLPKGKTLFNLNRVKNSRTVYVVESSFDAIRLDQCGFAAVATLGSNVSNFQVDLLKKYFNDIIVIADNDEAGGNMKTRLIEKLGSRVSVLLLETKYKDIGDMNDEDIKALSFSFDQSIAEILQ